MSYKDKYLKYKSKYLNLRTQIGGNTSLLNTITVNDKEYEIHKLTSNSTNEDYNKFIELDKSNLDNECSNDIVNINDVILQQKLTEMKQYLYYICADNILYVCIILIPKEDIDIITHICIDKTKTDTNKYNELLKQLLKIIFNNSKNGLAISYNNEEQLNKFKQLNISQYNFEVNLTK